jgi:hypothetical protein
MKRKILHHIIITMQNLKNKERTLKTVREKHQLTYKSKHLRITSDLSTQTLKAGKHGAIQFKLCERVTANQEHFIQQNCPSVSMEK